MEPERKQVIIEERKGKLKVCSKCKVEKDWLMDYYARPKSICKECVKIKNREYSKNHSKQNKEIKEKAKKQIKEIKQKALKEIKENKIKDVKYNKFDNLTQEKRNEIQKLFEDGLSLRKIEEETGICYNTLRNWKQRGFIQVDETKTNRFIRENKMGRNQKYKNIYGSLSDEKKQELRDYVEKGYTLKKISEKTGYKYLTVRQWAHNGYLGTGEGVVFKRSRKSKKNEEENQESQEEKEENQESQEEENQEVED